MKTGIFQTAGRSSSGRKTKRTSSEDLDVAADENPQGSSDKAQGTRRKKARHCWSQGKSSQLPSPPPPPIERRATRGSARAAMEAVAATKKSAQQSQRLAPIPSEAEGYPGRGSKPESSLEDSSDGEWEGDSDPRPLFPRTSTIFLPLTVKDKFKGWIRLRRSLPRE